jgi:hypothetical protein
VGVHLGGWHDGVLYRTGRFEAMMHDLLHEVQPSGILFNTFAPDERADKEAIAAGAALPGWQLSFFEPIESLPVDDSGARRQTIATCRSRRRRWPPPSDCRDYRQLVQTATPPRPSQDRPGGGGVARTADAAGLDARARSTGCSAIRRHR